jgi:hypothetical protein
MCLTPSLAMTRWTCRRRPAGPAAALPTMLCSRHRRRRLLYVVTASHAGAVVSASAAVEHQDQRFQQQQPALLCQAPGAGAEAVPMLVPPLPLSPPPLSEPGIDPAVLPISAKTYSCPQRGDLQLATCTSLEVEGHWLLHSSTCCQS